MSGRAPALYDLRAKALRLVAWLDANDPARARWALRQSTARALETPGATRFLLPRASWRAFWTWRRVVRQLVALLILLHGWWEVLIPLRRPSSPRPTAEETTDASKPPRLDGTRYRAQSERDGRPRALRELLHGAM
jgi:hypothetical protein